LSQGIVLQLGETIRLKCDVYGDPEPSYVWTTRKPKAINAAVLPNQRKSELAIPDIRVKDAVYYGCKATNRAGNISVEAVLVDVDGK
jgi:hypothetical protein